MRPTSRNQKLAAEPAAACSWPARRNTHQQWGRIKYCTNNKSSDVIGCRGQIGRTVHQRQNSHVHATDTRRNGTSATTNSHSNQQFYRTCTTYQQNPPQGIESHGYVIQLAMVPRHTGPILILLETRNAKPSRLLDQTPPGQPPQVVSSPNSDITHRSRVPKSDYSKEYCVQNICQKYPKNSNLCGTISCKTTNTSSPKCLRAKRQGCVRLAQTGQAYLAIGHCQKRFPPQNIPSLLLVTRLIL